MTKVHLQFGGLEMDFYLPYAWLSNARLVAHYFVHYQPILFAIP